MIPVLALVAVVLLFWKKNKPLVFGILFFVFNIFFVLQLFMHNTEAMLSDRYAYLGSIGIFLIMGVLLEMFLKNKSKTLKTSIYVVLGGYMVFMSVSTFQRSQVWENDETLFGDVIEKYPKSHIGWNNLANAQYRNGKTEVAKTGFQKVIELNPTYSQAYSNLANIEAEQGKLEGAIQLYNHAISLDSLQESYYGNRGSALIYLERFEEAISDFNRAIELQPEYAKAYLNRGLALCYVEEIQAATKDFSAALKNGANPEEVSALCMQMADLFNIRGVEYAKDVRLEDAIADFDKALTIVPGNENATNNKAMAVAKLQEVLKENLPQNPE